MKIRIKMKIKNIKKVDIKTEKLLSKNCLEDFSYKL